MPVRYTRVGWQDAPSTDTPIDAANLNHMDNGILALSQEMDTELPSLREDFTSFEEETANRVTTLQNGLPTMIGEQIDTKFGDSIGDEVSSWLTEHVDPVGSAVVVDDSLSVEGAAADAEKTGTLIRKNAWTGTCNIGSNIRDKVVELDDSTGFSTVYGTNILVNVLTFNSHEAPRLKIGENGTPYPIAYPISESPYYQIMDAEHSSHSAWGFGVKRFMFMEDCWLLVNPDFVQMDSEVDDLGSEVDDLKSELDIILDISVSPNIFTGYTQDGGLNNTSGEETTSTAYVRSDYIQLDTSQSTLYVLRQTAEWGMRIFFYNSSKTFLSNTQIFNGSATVLSASCAIPENAVYIRTYRSTSASGWVSLSYEQVDQYYEPNVSISEIKDEIIEVRNLSASIQDDLSALSDIKTDITTKKTINIFDGTFPSSGYIDTDGSDISGSSYERTDYIPIDSTNDTLYILRTAQPYVLAYYFYDSTKAGVGSRSNAFGGSSTDLTTTVPIPSGASYIRMYTKTADYSGNLMLSYTQESAYVSYGEHYALKDGVVSEDNLDSALQAKVNSGLKLTGKIIAFMGDSIIGNFYDATGVCAILAEKTGATVINCAFGGSRIAYRYGSNIQYTYWNALSGAGLADAIASGTWTDQDTAVANMTGGLAYFAERLATVKAVDWSKVDFIMWEYGTNDFMTEVALTGNDFYAYDYAYRHTIETILTAYPNIRIITATPTYRWYQSSGVFTDDSNTHEEDDYAGVSNKLTDFVAKAQEISREYQIHCIDDYYSLGANRYTRLAYFDSTDGTHPNANGRKRIAEHISAQLISLV